MKLGIARFAGLLFPQQLDDAERQKKCGAQLELHPGECLEMQRMLDKRFAERDSTTRIVGRQSDTAPHSGHGRHGVVDACHIEERRNLAYPVTRAANELGGCALESQLRSRKSAGPELVLESIDANVAQQTVTIAKSYEKHTQPGSARGRPFDARQRHSH